MADVTITAASFLLGANAKLNYGTAGAAITRGQPLYKDASDSKTLKLADADAAASAECVGLACQDVATGQRVEYVYEDDDLTVGGTLAVGGVYAVSATAGGIAPIADLVTGDFPTLLGIAKSTTKMILKIQIGGVAKA